MWSSPGGASGRPVGESPAVLAGQAAALNAIRGAHATRSVSTRALCSLCAAAAAVGHARRLEVGGCAFRDDAGRSSAEFSSCRAFTFLHALSARRLSFAHNSTEHVVSRHHGTQAVDRRQLGHVVMM